MRQRTYSVLRCFRQPKKALVFRDKSKSAKQKVQAREGPKDYVYFLHNHVVPLYSFEDALEKLKVYTVELNKDPQQTITMCIKCQGLDKVSLRILALVWYKYLVSKTFLNFMAGNTHPPDWKVEFPP